MRAPARVALALMLLAVALPAAALAARTTAADQAMVAAAKPAPWTQRYARCPKGAGAGPYCQDIYLGDFGRQLRFGLKQTYCPHLPYVKAQGSWSFAPNLKVRSGRFDQIYVYDSLLPAYRDRPDEWQVTFRLKGSFTATTLRVVITGTVTRDNDNLDDCKDVHVRETHVLRRKDF